MSKYLNIMGDHLDRRILFMEPRSFDSLKEIVDHAAHSLSSLPSWNPQPTWVEILKQLAKTGRTQMLFHLGKKIPEELLFPQEVRSIPDALASIDTVYHNHCHLEKDVGHYHLIHLDDQCAKIVSSTPYPCEFDRGVIESVCQRFKSKDVEFVIVEHLDGFPCRQKGSDSCTYSISWITTSKENQRFEKVTIVPPLLVLN